MTARRSEGGAPVPSPRRRGGSWLRVRALVRKEWLQIFRDPSSIAIGIVMPVLLLLLFGYGVSLDAENVPVAIVVEHLEPDAQELIGRFQLSRYFKPRVTTSLAAAEEALRARQVEGIIRVRANFARELRQDAPAPIQVIVNGVDANRARTIEGYAAGVWQTWRAQRALTSGGTPAPPIALESRRWFNEEVRSQNFLIPGLIVLIMTLIGALLTALVMAREWERGTMEALLVTPVRVRELLLGKLVPNFVLGMGGMALAVVMARVLFDVPLRGSLLVLTATSTVFMVVSLAMGLFISTVTRSQFVAAQAAIVGTFLPAFFLSGFLFEISSMPAVIQAITRIIPARYFVMIVQTVFLAGDVPRVIAPNVAALLIMAVLFLGVTRLKTRKRLE